MMNLFVSIYSIVVCIISGYSGGYFLDKQMKASNVTFTLITVPKSLRRVFLFCNLYPWKIILESLVIETSGILSSMLILAVSILFPSLPTLFILLIMMLHCAVLVVVGCVAHIKYLRTIGRLKASKGPFKCRFLRLLSGKPVVCLVELVESPTDRADDKYVVRYGRKRNKIYQAQTISKYSYESGRRYNAIYRNEFPHFILLPPSDSEY